VKILDQLLPRVLCADPPWKFGDALPGTTRGAENNYDVMGIDDIRKLDIPPLADDCHLFLWRVSAMVEEAYSVVRAWGFVPKSEIVWRKLTTGGKRWFGMGRHVRMEHEVCIIATRGKPKVRDRATRSIFEADAPAMFAAPCEGHSRKPDEFYGLVETLCEGPYLELFARRERAGWTTLGNQVPNNPTTLGVVTT
jgi:N6-adenosine-specific RNA methylase IME4